MRTVVRNAPGRSRVIWRCHGIYHNSVLGKPAEEVRHFHERTFKLGDDDEFAIDEQYGIDDELGLIVASQVAQRVSELSIEQMGGIGFTRELGIEKYWQYI